jgi:hypothetical protein
MKKVPGRKRNKMFEIPRILLTEIDFVPCWHELSWDEKRIALILRVHRMTLPCLEKHRLKNIKREQEIVHGIMKNKSLDEFGLDLSGEHPEDHPVFSRILKKNRRNGQFCRI